jgi:hypothetical protein
MLFSRPGLQSSRKMNQSLHFYLIGLVANARELIITTDNARIPMEFCRSRIACSDGSVHSGYSGYASLMSDNSGGSSMGSRSSRWDSEAGPDSNNKEKKSARPKIPPRRQSSSSPPSSPSRNTAISKPRSPQCRLLQANRKRVAGRLAVDDEAVNRGRRSASFEEPLNLASIAAKDILRIPQRRSSSGGEPSSRSQRCTYDKTRFLRRHSKNGEPDASRNIREILGEAIRELVAEKEMPDPYTKQLSVLPGSDQRSP